MSARKEIGNTSKQTERETFLSGAGEELLVADEASVENTSATDAHPTNASNFGSNDCDFHEHKET